MNNFSCILILTCPPLANTTGYWNEIALLVEMTLAMTMMTALQCSGLISQHNLMALMRASTCHWLIMMAIMVMTMLVVIMIIMVMMVIMVMIMVMMNFFNYWKPYFFVKTGTHHSTVAMEVDKERYYKIECQRKSMFYFQVTEFGERSGKINNYWMGHVAGSAAKTIDTELNTSKRCLSKPHKSNVY